MWRMCLSGTLTESVFEVFAGGVGLDVVEVGGELMTWECRRRHKQILQNSWWAGYLAMDPVAKALHALWKLHVIGNDTATGVACLEPALVHVCCG